MKANRRWRPLAVLCLLGAGGVCGCMPGNYMCSTPTPHDEVGTACQTLPRCQREQVHVFLVNGLDPRYMGRLDVVRDYIRRLGFTNTYLGKMYKCSAFEDKIRLIHAEQPDACFVLVGFGYGANLVKDMANTLGAEGIDIGLMVYLAGDTLENTHEYRPTNVRRIVNVTGKGCVWNWGGLIYDGVDLDDADNLRLEKAGHYDIPTNLRTLALLTCRLGEVGAGAVPLTIPDPTPPAPTLPAPRKVPPAGENLSQK